MTRLTELSVVRGAVLGEQGSEMMAKFATMNGFPYSSETGVLAAAFRGQKSVFTDFTNEVENRSNEETDVFLLCVSVAPKNSLEQTIRTILDTVSQHVGVLPFVLVGTDIDLRMNSSTTNSDSRPMSLSDAERFARQIGAKKYLECSVTTGEGVEDVLEEAFAVGRQFALERNLRRKQSQIMELERKNSRKQSCIQQ